MLLATKLSSALVTTSKVANLLDWHKAVGSVMSLDISMKSIGVAVSHHPEQHNSICESSTIPLRPILLHSNVNNDKRNLVTKNVIWVRSVVEPYMYLIQSLISLTASFHGNDHSHYGLITITTTPEALVVEIIAIVQ